MAKNRRTIAIGAALSAILLLGDLRAHGRPGPMGPAPTASGASAEVALTGTPPCPPAALSDDGVCVGLSESAIDEGEAVAVVANGHRDTTSVWRVYDQLPRRPERPEEYDRYVYPVAPGMGGRGGPLGKSVVSGYDLDKPDALQRRSSHLKHVGHGAVDLPQRRGAPIALVTLEHQEGDAAVLYDAVLFGNTVITLHHVREAGALRDYAVLYGHLEATATGVDAGKTLPEGTTIAFVGDSGSPNLVHLHLEVRRIREGVDAFDAVKRYGGGALLMNHIAVVCDPRNVLPLKPQADAVPAPSTKPM